MGTLIIAALYFAFYYFNLHRREKKGEDEFQAVLNLENEGFYNLDSKGLRKYLLINHIDGKFDWGMVSCYFIGSVLSSMIFASSALTFTLSNLAGLNSGIAISIWSTLPFFAALVEFFTIKTKLRPYQLIGMVTMIFGACLVSLSDIFYGN